MKSTLKNIGLAFLTSITLFSCTPNEVVVPTKNIIQNVAPTNDSFFSANDATKPITFRWTPVVPKPQEPVVYRLKVWQLMQGQNGSQAMRSNPPIVTKDVDNITQTVVSGIYTGPCRPPYLCDFVWTVEVVNSTGVVTGNTQTSSPTMFHF